VPYLYERDGTSCENLPETHEYLRELRRHVDRRFPNRMLLAEANQWPEDAVAYFGAGDECHMAFHFPIMPRLYLSLRMEDSFPILDILEQTPEIPSSAQWAIFLRNHDELTLEMVTDEERDLMLRAYASELPMRINLGIRRRLAPLLDNNRRRIELMNALLFSLPGTPVLYYGDEIGMGDNVYLGDRNGVRTPMQWSPDRNAGFSRANPQRLFLPPVVDPEYHYEAVNVENQQRNPSSLLWWTKRMIALRKQYPAFGRGSFEPLTPANRRILAFLRRHEGSTILVVANLSRFTQHVALDLAAYKGHVPVELFGGTRFPAVGSSPYRLTLGSHDFFWFSLEPANADAETAQEEEGPPEIGVRESWTEIFERRRRDGALSAALGAWLSGRRWFRAKSRQIKTLELSLVKPVGGKLDARLGLLEVAYATGEPETYVVALGVSHAPPERAIARIRSRRDEVFLVDASEDPETAEQLLAMTLRKRRVETPVGEVIGRPSRNFLRDKGEVALPARRLGVEQSNTSFAFGDSVVCKVLRKLEPGASVEVEMLRELGSSAEALGIPLLMGTLDLEKPDGTLSTLASFTRFVPNQGDAWQYTLDEVNAFFDRVLARGNGPPPKRSRLRAGARRRKQPEGSELVGGYLAAVRLMARRTAELHKALAASEHPDFAPVSYTALSRRAAYQSLRSLSARAFEMLKREQRSLAEPVATVARTVLKKRAAVSKRLSILLERPFGGRLIRVHGDYHLGQVLYRAGDFSIIDFEGEPGRSLADRRRRRSPLVDVAGMMRSFHYAVFGLLHGGVGAFPARPEDLPQLEPWAAAWYDWVSSAFFDAYRDELAETPLLPSDPRELATLLDVFLLEKALYELCYELDNRPTWAAVPLLGLADLTR